jgi:hypothetical protein
MSWDVGSGFSSAFSNVCLTSDFCRTLVGFSNKSEVYKLFMNSGTALTAWHFYSNSEPNKSDADPQHCWQLFLNFWGAEYLNRWMLNSVIGLTNLVKLKNYRYCIQNMFFNSIKKIYAFNTSRCLQDLENTIYSFNSIIFQENCHGVVLGYKVTYRRENLIWGNLWNVNKDCSMISKIDFMHIGTRRIFSLLLKECWINIIRFQIYIYFFKTENPYWTE